MLTAELMLSQLLWDREEQDARKSKSHLQYIHCEQQRAHSPARARPLPLSMLVHVCAVLVRASYASGRPYSRAVAQQPSAALARPQPAHARL